MTVKHWTEADYYAASRRARAAWEATQPQLSLLSAGSSGSATHGESRATGSPPFPTPAESGLEGADAGTTSLVASAPSSPPEPVLRVLTRRPINREGGLDNPTTRETP